MTKMKELELPTAPKRQFLEDTFTVSTWEALQPWYDNLLHREIESVKDLLSWLHDRSELESVISENMAWRYIHMTCYTGNKEYSKAYQDFVENIQPKIAPLSDQLNKKIAASPYVSELETTEGYDIMFRTLKKEIEIFREANVPLYTKINMESQKYGQLAGAMTVEMDGKELTLQQAAVLLMSTDRSVRENVFHKISERRLKDKEEFDTLFSSLIGLRNQVATNAGFPNFRDYMFQAMGRFDYTPQDCFDFHAAIQKEVVPLLDGLSSERKEKLKIDQLRPWDKAVDAEGKDALKPFSSADDLTAKTISCFAKLDPYLGQCLSIMKEMGHLDLDSRKGKAPGGYNYPLAEIGVPFIFMNATSTVRDMVTILHEGGHAIHNFVTRDLELNDFKSTPSEVAELASMAMELISMDHWDVYFENEDDLKRAKREHLEDIIETLPWIATIDHFQHWIYENPTHTLEERKKE